MIETGFCHNFLHFSDFSDQPCRNLRVTSLIITLSQRYLSEEPSYLYHNGRHHQGIHGPIIWLLTMFQNSIRRSTHPGQVEDTLVWEHHYYLEHRSSFTHPTQKCVAGLFYAHSSLDREKDREREYRSNLPGGVTRYFSQPRNPRQYACPEILNFDQLLILLSKMYNNHCMAGTWIAIRNS